MATSSITESLELRENNPYSLGSIFVFDEGDMLLDGGNYTFQKSPRDRHYTVEQDDDLTTIAFKAYGDSKKYWIIQKANDIDFAFDLQRAQTLLIPDLETFKVTSLPNG